MPEIATWEQAPSIGGIVHYVDQVDGEPKCRAAIITEVCAAPHGTVPQANTPCVSLHVFYPPGHLGGSDSEHVPHHEGSGRLLAPGSWHWPERVGP